ncbi:DNA polymerase Y family protein [Nitratifractor sp.]
MFLHLDIDSFFVSAERSRDPSLRGVPVAVGGRSNLEIFSPRRTRIRLMDLNEGAFVAPVFYDDRRRSFEERFIDRIDGREKIRGIVTTSSYEARERGVCTGMPLAQALRLCPELIVVPSDLLFYHRISHAITSFLSERIPRVEQFSIDEFFGDLSGWKREEEVEGFCRELQGEIFHRFHIPVSIGIARSKWIAKLATGFAKPYGIYRVTDVESFIREIPIDDFPGIGRGYRRRLEDRGVQTLGETTPLRGLFESWGKTGRQLYRRIHGIDGEGIEPRASRQSVGISRTFDPIRQREEIRRRVMILARHVCYITQKIEANPTRYFLGIRYDDGSRARGSERVERLFSERLLKETMARLFDRIHRPGAGAVKLSLSVSDFTRLHPRTLSLLELETDRRSLALSRGLQKVRERFGLDAIRTGNELGAGNLRTTP